MPSEEALLKKIILSFTRYSTTVMAVILLVF